MSLSIISYQHTSNHSIIHNTLATWLLFYLSVCLSIVPYQHPINHSIVKTNTRFWANTWKQTSFSFVSLLLPLAHEVNESRRHLNAHLHSGLCIYESQCRKTSREPSVLRDKSVSGFRGSAQRSAQFLHHHMVLSEDEVALESFVSVCFKFLELFMH